MDTPIREPASPGVAPAAGGGVSSPVVPIAPRCSRFRREAHRSAVAAVFLSETYVHPCDCRGHLQPGYARAERHLRHPDVGPVQGRNPL